MKQSTKTIASTFIMALLFAVALTLMMSGVVGAQQTNRGRDDVAVTAEAETENETETKEDSAVKAAAKQRAEELRAEARAKVEEKRKTRETLTADKRMKICENRKTAINNKLEAYSDAADKHLAKFDSIYVKVLAFQEDKGVTVTNINELTADADAKKKAAADAIALLKEVAVDVDCSDPDTAVTLGVVRDAAQTARKALHDYRMSLKNIVVAIAQADKAGPSEDDEADKTTESSTSQTTQEAN